MKIRQSLIAGATVAAITAGTAVPAQAQNFPQVQAQAAIPAQSAPSSSSDTKNPLAKLTQGIERFFVYLIGFLSLPFVLPIAWFFKDVDRPR